MNENILVVDDDPVAIQFMCRILSGAGNLRFATSGARALTLVHEAPPDLILLDAQMPGMSGFQVFDALRAEPHARDVPVIFVTSHGEPAFEVSALDLGAADFLAKPVHPPLLLARIRTHLRMKGLADELRRTTTIDALTGVANRRQFDLSLDREWLRCLRNGNPLSLVLIDVDHFKSYDDRYGHLKGDSCLRQVAETLVGACRRPADLVARCGGEEFVLLLPQTARDGAEHVARRAVDALARLGIRHDTSPTAPHLTVSVGISSYDEDSACWAHATADRRCGAILCASSDLVLAADKALSAATRGGRAQIKLLDIADAPGLADALEPILRQEGMACA